VTIEVRLRELSTQTATDLVTDLIGLAPDAEMWFRESIILRDGQPVALVQEYLPGNAGLAALDPVLARQFTAVANEPATLRGALGTEPTGGQRPNRGDPRPADRSAAARHRGRGSAARADPPDPSRDQAGRPCEVPDPGVVRPPRGGRLEHHAGAVTRPKASQ